MTSLYHIIDLLEVSSLIAYLFFVQRSLTRWEKDLLEQTGYLWLVLVSALWFQDIQPWNHPCHWSKPLVCYVSSPFPNN